AGDPRYERALRELERRHPGRAAARIGVDLELAHRIEAGADLFLMPSRYEPCGLNQMYSMRYGTVPVVRSTGGLADTVVDAAEGGRGTGYRFDAYAPQALAEALARALADFGTPRWVELQRRGMERDFSWAGPARQYLDVYRSLRPRAAAHAGAIP
ncbi:MAG: glycosyltransferase, partial [Gemmatimonadota bacterium]